MASRNVASSLRPRSSRAEDLLIETLRHFPPTPHTPPPNATGAAALGDAQWHDISEALRMHPQRSSLVGPDGLDIHGDSFLSALRSSTHVRPILGGNSNSVYLLQATTDADVRLRAQLIARVYGVFASCVSDTSRELGALMYCGELGVSPQVVAAFDWGRVEQFVVGEALTNARLLNDERALRTSVGAMKALHALNVREWLTFAPIPTALTIAGWNAEERWARIKASVVQCPEGKVGTIETVAETYASGLHASLQEVFRRALRSEVVFLQQVACRLPNSRVLVHNDLNPSNILMDETGNAHLIDFEYCGVYERWADVGNFVCELDYDYHSNGFTKVLYDAEPQVAGESKRPLHFPRLAEMLMHLRRGEESSAHARTLRTVLEEYYEVNLVPHTEALDSVYAEVLCGMLASHLYWALWAAVLGSKTSHGVSGLDYRQYADCRWREYFALKHFVQEEGLAVFQS